MCFVSRKRVSCCIALWVDGIHALRHLHTDTHAHTTRQGSHGEPWGERQKHTIQQRSSDMSNHGEHTRSYSRVEMLLLPETASQRFTRTVLWPFPFERGREDGFCFRCPLAPSGPESELASRARSSAAARGHLARCPLPSRQASCEGPPPHLQNTRGTQRPCSAGSPWGATPRSPGRPSTRGRKPGGLAPGDHRPRGRGPRVLRTAASSSAATWNRFHKRPGSPRLAAPRPGARRHGAQVRHLVGAAGPGLLTHHQTPCGAHDFLRV